MARLPRPFSYNKHACGVHYISHLWGFGVLGRELRHDLLRVCSALTTWVTRVPYVRFLRHFVSAQNNLLSVNYNNVVATVNVRCVIRLALASDKQGYLRCQTS